MKIEIPEPDPNFCESCIFNCSDCGSCSIYGYGKDVFEQCQNDRNRETLNKLLKIYYKCKIVE